MNSLKYILIVIIISVFEGIFVDGIASAQAVNPNIEELRQEKDTLKLPESISKEELEFLGSHEHRLHATGTPPSDMRYNGKIPGAHWKEELDRVGNKYRYDKLMDQAWTVMLYKQGLIPVDVAKKVLSALEKSEIGGENALKSLLGGDEYLASMTQLGRTTQEPMSRLQIREKQLDVIDDTHALLHELLDAIERNSGTIMPGMSHMAHAQPTTYGAYLLALYDGIYDGLENLELAYKQTNKNSGGCGATSGTGWPVDRNLVTELLGFNELIEPTYEGEAGQDFAMNTLFALSNTMITLSRTAMDHSIWGMDGYRTNLVPWGNAGVSSLMPQKAHSSSEYELIRKSANNVIGAMTVGMLGLKGEPFMDILPSYQASHWTSYQGAIGALCEVEAVMATFGDLIKNEIVDKEKLLQLTRDGWGCTPDLAVKLIREKGYASRQAHRICAVMVRIARIHRNIKPYELTGAMLDEAARISHDPEPHITTEEIREIMDPVKFIERHDNTGDPNPKETIRMVKIRRDQLKESEQQQTLRREKVETGFNLLKTEITNIINK